MKVLVQYEYPPSPGGLATQGELLYRGLKELGVDVYPVNPASIHEKEWYYKWLKPDVVVGIGYWGHAPDLVLHPQKFNIRPVPWLVADGYVANYQDVLNALPLVLVTSQWVKERYMQGGLNGKNIEVLPVGVDTDAFTPREMTDKKVAVIREALGIKPDQIMILTIGGDAASKGAQEVMQALALVGQKTHHWKYVCKVWPQPRTLHQNTMDMQLATSLGIEKDVIYLTSIASRNFMPFMIAACDIYAAPSRLEGFGMPQVEAGACGKPVLSIGAMSLLETLVHNETALLAGVAQEVVMREAIVGEEAGHESKHRIVFQTPHSVDYRASVHDIARYLTDLMKNPQLRQRLGQAGRKRVVENYDYRVVAKKFVKIMSEKLGLS